MFDRLARALLELLSWYVAILKCREGPGNEVTTEPKNNITCVRFRFLFAITVLCKRKSRDASLVSISASIRDELKPCLKPLSLFCHSMSLEKFQQLSVEKIIMENTVKNLQSQVKLSTSFPVHEGPPPPPPNEETLLRKHCFPECFLGAQTCGKQRFLAG